MTLQTGRRTDASTRWAALMQILIVAAIWSTSFVGVKAILPHAGPLSIAALRYSLGFALISPWLARGCSRWRSIPGRTWMQLAVMGLCQYAVGNGALFWALQFLPATAGSLVECLVPLPVTVLSVLWLRESLRPIQLTGVAAAVAGGLLFFSPEFTPSSAPALGALGVALGGFTLFHILARRLARDGLLRTLPLTALPMGIGGVTMLSIALPLEGLPTIPAHVWGIVLGMAAVNTAVAYLMFTHALRSVTAPEANVLLSLAPLGTAAIAAATLGERLSLLQVMAVLLAICGAACAQIRRKGARWAP